MKRSLFISIFLAASCLCVSALAFLFRNHIKPDKTTSTEVPNNPPKPANNVLIKLAGKSSAIQKFCIKNGFNSAHCFMIDMGIPSGRERFFIYDLKNNLVIDAGLVTHGSGSITTGNLVFSNLPGSNSTSLGRYKIGNDYMGKFGLAYKLHGLDKTNSNAYKRFVVLHAHSCVPDLDVYPLTICPSLGCPTVSPFFLQKLKSYIEGSTKPVLLYIYQ